MASPSQAFPKPEPEPIRLELVVEYSNTSIHDAMRSADRLIQDAMEHGLVVRASLFGVPPVIALV